MEQFTSSATVHSAAAGHGRFILVCFPQKTLEAIDPKNADKAEMSSAVIRRIPDFSILVIPEASSNTHSCGWFRVCGVVSFIIEVKSGYKKRLKMQPWRGEDFKINKEVISLFAAVMDLRQIIEQAQTAMRSKAIPLGRNGKLRRNGKDGKLGKGGKQKEEVTIHSMLIIAVWFACFKFTPAFLEQDLDHALSEMLLDMAKFCYRPPAAVFDSNWTTLSPQFLAALHQSTVGYPNSMFTITPHGFFQAPQPELAPDPKVSQYSCPPSKHLNSRRPLLSLIGDDAVSL